MKIFDVIILTEQRYLNPIEKNTYIQNVLDEDALVQNALENKGLNVERLSWDDSTFDWETARIILFRTTWDYFDRFTEFSEWLNAVSKKTILLNSEKLIRWNIDKHYLQDLSARGVHVCPSYFVEKGATISLCELSKKYNLNTFVLKPCVSGAARHTYKVNDKNVKDISIIFDNLIQNEAMILQPFQPNIVRKGELSLIVIDGMFSHAVLKKAKAGDFRVQDDFGGTVEPYTPNQKEIDFAENAVKACRETPVYARVDMFLDQTNALALAELELIEPELWFRHEPLAAERLATAIHNLIFNP